MEHLLKTMALSALLSVVIGSSATWKSEFWGYVNIRNDAHMFWWLYCAKGAHHFTEYPLVINLEGGPGGSSAGIGNFMELGPLDEKLKPRPTTWIERANLLFVDSPVGSGFSYVTQQSALCQCSLQVTEDLMVFLRQFLEKHPVFRKVPLYILGKSYGGKIATEFGNAIHKETKEGKLIINFKGVILGCPFISMKDHILSWGEYLYSMSMMSENEMEELNYKIYKEMLKIKMIKHDPKDSYTKIRSFIKNATYDVDSWNVFKVERHHASHENNSTFEGDILNFGVAEDVNPSAEFMNGPIRKKLGIIPKNVTWKAASDEVRYALIKDILTTSAISSVNSLLEASIEVNIYNGQLDPLVNILGTFNWMKQLKWKYLKEFLKAKKDVLVVANKPVGFSIAHKNFRFFWILKAGHFAIQDAPYAAVEMIDKILKK